MEKSRHAVCAAAGTGLVLSAALGLCARPGVLHGDLPNPDSAMRLVRIEAMLQAHQPLSAVMRDGSGAGTVLHWSHLLDSLVLLLAAPASLVLGWHGALAGVAVLFGPLSMAALGAAVAWAVAPLVARDWRWLPAVIACLSAPVIGYGLPGVLHHHVLLAACAAVMAGWALRTVQTSRGGVALGAWAAAACWLSPETMPLSLMAVCAVWLAWFRAPCAAGRRSLGRNLAGCGLAMAAVMTAAWLADPPAAGLWAVEQDRVSIVFVTLSAGAALCSLAAAAGVRRWLVLALGGALAASWLAVFPVLLQGSYGLLPAGAAHEFLDGIAEMQPVSAIGPAISFLLPSAVAGAWLAAAGLRRHDPLLVYAGACALLLVLGGAQHVRFAMYPAVLAAGLAAVALPRIRPGWRTAALAAGLLLPLSGWLVPAGQAAQAGERACGEDGLATLLAPYAGRVVLADVNETPALLWNTGVLTVGSLYHRNPAGFMRLRAAWRSEPGAAMPPAVAATGATLVLVCPSARLPRFVTDLQHPTLAATLKAGTVPPWLHPAGASAGGYLLYAAGPPPVPEDTP